MKGVILFIAWFAWWTFGLYQQTVAVIEGKQTVATWYTNSMASVALFLFGNIVLVKLSSKYS